jgi:uroporphyrinogen-III decarboxylase
MRKDLHIALSFISGWWSEHFYRTHRRPVVPSDDELERVCLERRRFLFEQFGRFGIGEENPAQDGRFVNVVTKWCVDFIPYLLGVKLRCQDEGFWHAEPLEEEQIKKLGPVDLAHHPFAEWMLRRKDLLTRRYGRAEIGQTLEGSVNAACRIRGQEFYYDLASNRDLARRLLGVIAETVIKTYEFFAREFDLQSIFLANCSNVHIGPGLYEEMCLENDIRIVTATRPLFKKDRYAFLHHCDAPADKFMDLYGRIPSLSGTDAGYPTDIRRARAKLPGVNVCLFINPVAVQQLPLGVLNDRALEAIGDGADAFSVANIDPVTDPDKVRALLGTLVQCCEEAGRNPVCSAPPLAADEEEWAFPMYQGDRAYQGTDDRSVLIPRA